MLKSEVRTKAKSLDLLTSNKPDSMGICFIGEVSVSKLLKERLGEKRGEVVIRKELGIRNQELAVGTHRGLWFYTIGERGGFEIDKNKLKKLGMHPEKMGPLYVIGKDSAKNQLIVGSREETMKGEIRFQELGIRNQDLGKKLWVRIRNLGELIEVSEIKDDWVILKEKIFGVAQGQSAVFYDGEGILVGGAIIV
jgi:tRNA-specific 2-thiouridylase